MNSPRLLLACSHLAVPWLGPVLRNLLGGCRRVAVVTTAEPKLKERSLNAVLAQRAVEAAGVRGAPFVDLEAPDHAGLAGFDAVCLASGNPFPLLDALRATRTDCELETLVASGHPLVACGPSAMVLGQTLRHLRLFDPSVSDLGGASPVGLGLLPFSLLPHANRWRARWRDYPERLDGARQVWGEIVELDDDEALGCAGQDVVRLVAHPCARYGAVPSGLPVGALSP
jgi:peptidase E